MIRKEVIKMRMIEVVKKIGEKIDLKKEEKLENCENEKHCENCVFLDINVSVGKRCILINVFNEMCKLGEVLNIEIDEEM